MGRKLKTAVLLFILLLAAFSSGCGSNSKGETAQKPEVRTEEKAAPPESGKEAGEEEREMIEATGEYVGQIDPHSVEIKVKNDSGEYSYTAFQLEYSIMDGFEEKRGLSTGDMVEFKYYVDEYRRPVIVELKKI